MTVIYGASYAGEESTVYHTSATEHAYDNRKWYNFDWLDYKACMHAANLGHNVLQEDEAEWIVSTYWDAA